MRSFLDTVASASTLADITVCRVALVQGIRSSAVFEDAALRCCGGRGGVVRGHDGDDNVAMRGVCDDFQEEETQLWRNVERSADQICC